MFDFRISIPEFFNIFLIKILRPGSGKYREDTYLKDYTHISISRVKKQPASP